MPDAAAAPASPASVAPSLAAADRLSQPTRMPGRAGRCCRGREDSHVTTASAIAAANVGYLHGRSRGRGGCAGVIDGWGRRRGLGGRFIPLLSCGILKFAREFPLPPPIDCNGIAFAEFVLGRSSFLSLPFAVDFFSLMRALILPLRKVPYIPFVGADDLCM